MATCEPCAAKARLIASPIPLLPPVTRTTCPDSPASITPAALPEAARLGNRFYIWLPRMKMTDRAAWPPSGGAAEIGLTGLRSTR